MQEAVHVEVVVLENLNSDPVNAEAATEKVHKANAEPMAEDEDANSVHSAHTNSGLNASLSDSEDNDSAHVQANPHDIEAHYREMYFANWSGADTVFSAQRAADFVAKSAPPRSAVAIIISITIITISSKLHPPLLVIVIHHIWRHCKTLLRFNLLEIQFTQYNVYDYVFNHV